jgi:hypothetical protein
MPIAAAAPMPNPLANPENTMKAAEALETKTTPSLTLTNTAFSAANAPRGRPSSHELAEIAERELLWFHAKRSESADAATVQARRTIDAWLSKLDLEQREVLYLSLNQERDAHPALAKATTRPVRLLIKLHNERNLPDEDDDIMRVLEARVLEAGSAALWDLETRADRLFDDAMRAYRKARGKGPCVVQPVSEGGAS